MTKEEVVTPERSIIPVSIIPECLYHPFVVTPECFYQGSTVF